ncbi:MAG: hypothetical protein ACRDIB_20065 [Ardenticatenaceae bacterium]
MGSLELWGAIAAIFLVLQCIMFNAILVGLALGLWKGAGWLRVHAGVGLDKVEEWLLLGRGYLRQGESYLVAPFIRLRGRITSIRTTWQRLRG